MATSPVAPNLDHRSFDSRDWRQSRQCLFQRAYLSSLGIPCLNPLRSVRPANRLPFDPPSATRAHDRDAAALEGYSIHRRFESQASSRHPVVFSFGEVPRRREVYLLHRTSCRLYEPRTATCFPPTGSVNGLACFDREGSAAPGLHLATITFNLA